MSGDGVLPAENTQARFYSKDQEAVTNSLVVDEVELSGKLEGADVCNGYTLLRKLSTATPKEADEMAKSLQNRQSISRVSSFESFQGRPPLPRESSSDDLLRFGNQMGMRKDAASLQRAIDSKEPELSRRPSAAGSKGTCSKRRTSSLFGKESPTEEAAPRPQAPALYRKTSYK